MNFDEFFGSLFPDWESSGSNSNSTPVPNFSYTSSTDENGTYIYYESNEYSFEEYVPIQTINLEKILDRLRLEEAEFVHYEQYENAAVARDKIKSIELNKDKLIKLYDLKERAIKQGDYKFATIMRDKIHELINGKE